MLLTEMQASLLANTLNQIRPDWTVPSLMSLLVTHRTVPSFGALVIAATTKAMEPSCKTPEPIFRQGPHWPAEVAKDMPRPPRCRIHGDFYEPCRCCAADRKAERRQDPYETPEAVTDVAASSAAEEAW